MESDAHQLGMFFLQFIYKSLCQCLSRRRHAASAAQVFHREVVEIDHRIGFGPQANPSCVPEGAVLGRDFQLAVVIATELVSARLDSDFVPDAASPAPTLGHVSAIYAARPLSSTPNAKSTPCLQPY